jgi:hypothetical protein
MASSISSSPIPRCSVSLSIGKRDVARLATVLEQNFSTVEEAAKAALAEAFAIYEEKARFTVVGQLYYGEGGYIDHEDAAASKVALGRYGTERQAQSAAESLVINGRDHEEFQAWVLPVWNGSPASYFAERAEERKRQELSGKTGLEARLQRRIDFFRANPGVLVLPPEIDDPW